MKGRGIGLPRQSASIVAAGRRSDQASEGLRGRLVRQRNHRRVDGHHGGRRASKGDAEDWGVYFRHPLTSGLFFSGGRSQQGAVAALHQSEAGLDQADDLIPHLVRSPIPLGNALGGQQNFSDFAIGGAVGPCIRRTQGKRYSPPAIRRNRVRRRALRPAIEPSPQTSAGIRPEFEVAVERKFDGVGSSDDRRFFEPNTMLYAAQDKHGVPAIRTLPKLTFVQLAEIQPDVCMRADKRRRADRHNRRHGLGSPEDGLFEEGSIGISCEKPTPNAAGIRPLKLRPDDGIV